MLRYALVLMAVMCSAAARAHAADWFVDASIGDDAAPGSQAFPLKSLARLSEVLAPGDRANLSGVFRENLKVRRASGCTIRQWPARPQAVIRGDVPVAPSDWTQTAPGFLDLVLPDAALDDLNESVASVIVDWDKQVDAQGRHFGHLKRVATLPEVQPGSRTWAFQRNGLGGGWLRVGLDVSTGAFPEIAWCRGNMNGIEIGTPTYNNYPTWGAYDGQDTIGLTIDGLHLYLWCDSGARAHLESFSGEGVNPANPPGTRSIGYGVRIADGVGCVIRNVVTRDTGYHGVGFVGDACRDNLFENCDVWGGAPNRISGNSSFVFYTGPGLGVSNISGCVGRLCRAFKYTFLGLDGRPIDAGAGADGYICHTNGVGGNRVTDVEWVACDVYESADPFTGEGCVGDGLVGGTWTSEPWDPVDWQSYPIRFVSCRSFNAARNLTSGDGHVAYVNCSFDLRRAGAEGMPDSGQLGARSGTAMTLFAGCEIVADLDRDGLPMRLFSCSSDNQVLLINSSVYITGSTTASPSEKSIFILSGVAKRPIFARGCVFGFRNRSADLTRPHRLATGSPSWVGSADAPFTNQFYYDFRDCAYFNLDAFGGTPAVDEEIEWRAGWGGAGSNGSVIDAPGVYLADANPFADPSGGDLDLAAFFREYINPLDIKTEYGINGCPYAGNYGAWQYGSAAVIYEQPQNMVEAEGKPVTFSVDAAGAGPLTFRWRHDGVPLSNGPVVSGALSRKLTLLYPQGADAGFYDVEIRDNCGLLRSSPATLELTCPADLNADSFVDAIDYDIFLRGFFSGTPEADFNADGFVDAIDLDQFLIRFLSGC